MRGQKGIPARQITKDKRLALVFFFGLVLGSLLFNWWGKHYLEEMVIWQSALHTSYLTAKTEIWKLLSYLLWTRGKRLVLFFLVFSMGWRHLAENLYHLYFGFSFGWLISAMTMTYHLWTIGIFFLWSFPHYICYFFLWRLIMSEKISWKKSKKILLGTFFFILGILLEGLLNPLLLRYVLQKI